MITISIFTFGRFQYVEYFKLATNSGYIGAEDLSTCRIKKGDKECILYISNRILTGADMQLAFVDQSIDQQITAATTDIKSATSTGSISNILISTKKLLLQKDKLLADYIKENNSKLPAIDKVLAMAGYEETTNYYFNGDWAVVTLLGQDTDPANLILKNTNNSWTIIYGPGTGADIITLTTAEVPKRISLHFDQMYDKTIVKYPSKNYKSSQVDINNIINSNEAALIANLPLEDLLPFSQDNFSVYINYEDIPAYIVTINYYTSSDQSASKKAALLWFQDNGQNPDKLNIVFEFLQYSEDE